MTTVENDLREGLAIGLTGGIACGKTEVGRVLSQLGVDVCDADEIAHGVIAAGSAAYDRVVSRFGRGIVDENSEIDRQKLGEIVFRDAEARKELEEIIHPQVIGTLREWVADAKAKGRDVVGIVPLLFEVGLTDLWDAVICVAAENDRVLERLRQRGLSDDEALARIAAQMPLQEKRSRSDYLIENDGTLEDLASYTKTTWKNLLKKESRSHGRT